jgi:hypothetical protein
MLRRVAIGGAPFGGAPFGGAPSGSASRLPNVGTRGAIARDAIGLLPFFRPRIVHQRIFKTGLNRLIHWR